jgi:site-specific recombinase XerD
MSARLQDLERSFARHLRAEGRADRTVVIYGQSIKFFSRWLEAQGREATVDELTRAAIREWLAQLADVNEASTIKTRYRGLFRLCGWLVDEGEIDEHPMKTLSPPQPKMKPVPILSDEDLAALLKACTGKEFHNRRDEALIRLLLDCGLRVSELCGLTVEGVDLDNGMTLVRGKGNKLRPVYFGARTARAVDRYLRMRSAHRWAHLDNLMLTQRGGLSPDGVRERMNVLAAAAGLDHLHPHQFRHTFAHDFLINGGQERDLKRLGRVC